jgi:hypothetical protein
MVVINGTIPAEILASTTGTVLSPLAEVAGQSVIWLGSLLVVLSLGLGCIQVALVLYYLVDERLPAQPSNGIFRRFSDRGRFWLAISPVILAFLLTELIALTGRGSFTSFLGIIGALSLPMLGGMIPVLLLAATRRKGDFEPGLVSRLVGNPILLTAIYLFFLATIFTHGLFIWEDPLPRILAIGIGIWVLGVTVRMLLRGTMKKRISIELREDQRLEGNNILQIVSGGQQFAVEAQLKTLDREENVQGEFVQLPDFEQVNSISLQVEPDEARTVKIWAHRLTAEGSSQGLPVSIEITSGNESQRFDLGETGEKISFPIMGETQQIYFSFSRE